MATVKLSPEEENVMHMAFKATLLRAADLIDKITEDDVLDAQAALLADGCSLEKVAKVDRAMLAASHLRALARDSK